ncbi:MAG: DinB family protein [Anaerolineaceae bacterium]|jgi:hypothetical protein|nr:DinB family protein [Anaerolineaceae bacterium]
MTHPLVTQLRFARHEFQRAIKTVNQKDAEVRILPMNCISWNIGHLAWQEQRYFLYFAQGRLLIPEIDRVFAFGAPASTPSLKEVLSAWHTITAEIDPWLETVSTQTLLEKVVRQGNEDRYTFGNLFYRTIYHYWYHTGENMAIRQQLGHQGLPVFVGNVESRAPYIPEISS